MNYFCFIQFTEMRQSKCQQQILIPLNFRFFFQIIVVYKNNKYVVARQITLNIKITAALTHDNFLNKQKKKASGSKTRAPRVPYKLDSSGVTEIRMKRWKRRCR